MSGFLFLKNRHEVLCRSRTDPPVLAAPASARLSFRPMLPKPTRTLDSHRKSTDSLFQAQLGASPTAGFSGEMKEGIFFQAGLW